MSDAQQFGRVCTLIVAKSTGDAIDLSNFNIKFNVKRSDTMTPNVADIRVYNLSQTTAMLIKKEFTQIILQAGYASNSGVIFKGNIKQVIIGRENATDTFVDILGGDGDQAYNFAIVNTTLKAGSTPQDQLNVTATAMNGQGVSMGQTVGALPTTKLPRGKVMYGPAKDHIRSLADSNGFGWSIQNEQINFIKSTTYLPGTVTVITSKTGMIGTPEQTNQGVNVKTLLNPNIKIAGRILIDNASVQQTKINFSVPGSADNNPAPLNADGTYYVLVAEHIGNNRGLEWYTNIITATQLVTSNPANSVTIGAGA